MVEFPQLELGNLTSAVVSTTTTCTMTAKNATGYGTGDFKLIGADISSEYFNSASTFSGWRIA
jgi:hypothetical protein